MSSAASIEADPRRWKALGVLALIQFMLVLDITVVNVALPHIDNDLDFSATGRRSSRRTLLRLNPAERPQRSQSSELEPGGRNGSFPFGDCPTDK